MDKEGMLARRSPKCFRLRGMGVQPPTREPPLGAPPKPLEPPWGPFGGPRGGLAHHLWEVTGGLSPPGCPRELPRDPPERPPEVVILQIWGVMGSMRLWEPFGAPLGAL